jgi:FixJ family two-component response regulator
MTQTKIYLVDDDAAVRTALTLLLQTVGFEVCAYSEPLEFLAKLPGLEPGCIVMDIRMPRISGLKVQENLNHQGCTWPLVIISGHGDIDICRQVFKNGAIDFLSKPIDEQDLIDAIQRGNALLEQESMKAAQAAETRELLEQLTPRELEILGMISLGWSTKEIAVAIEISPRTVESHRAHIAGKLGTTSVAEMARLVVESQQ